MAITLATLMFGNDASAVPLADELFGAEALERLRCSQDFIKPIARLRASEAHIAERVERMSGKALMDVYASMVDDVLSGVGLALPGNTYDDATSLFRTVIGLPVLGKTAKARRKAREVARVAMLLNEDTLHIPARADELRGIWEQAMLGEPRWSVDLPSSAFRTRGVTVRGPMPEREVLHRCMDPEEIPAWLDRLIQLLVDERLASELRATCGLGMHDWIHPFNDGNGHTGRLLMIATLQGRYSQLTLVCLAYELVVNRPATSRQFARLRNREADAIGFCLGLLDQIKDAQAHVLSILA